MKWFRSALIGKANSCSQTFMLCNLVLSGRRMERRDEISINLQQEMPFSALKVSYGFYWRQDFWELKKFLLGGLVKSSDYFYKHRLERNNQVYS